MEPGPKRVESTKDDAMNITSSTPIMPSPQATSPQAPPVRVGAVAPQLSPVAPQAATLPETATSPLLEAALEEANKKLQGGGNVEFAVHEGSNRVVVRVVDPQSMEVVREFPNTDLLDMVSKLQELSGLALDETA
jgi:flagellar protein FlaG